MTEDKGNNITRRKLIGSVAVAGVASGVGGAGTYAYLTDDDSISSTFEVGSLEVELTPAGGKMDFDSLEEGEQNTSEISICNEGSLPIRNVILDGITITGDTEVAEAIKVLEVAYGGEPITDSSKLDDDNGNGVSDLDDLNTWLQPDGRSLTGSTSVGTLNGTDDGGAECALLVIKTEMDYSALSSGAPDNASISAEVEVTAEQESL